MVNTVVLDLFLGDSGKGKIADYLAKTAKAVVRFNGSNNAGHTLVLNGQTFKTHAVPSGVLHPHTMNYIGHGCTIDPLVLMNEIEQFKNHNNNIYISGQAHIILPRHIELDIERESVNAVGSTKRGVAPAYEAKHGRYGLRYESLLLDRKDFEEKLKSISTTLQAVEKGLEIYDKCAQYLAKHIVRDGVIFAHYIASNGSIVFEGAQGTFLDIDVGDYPYVTSSNCTIGSVMSGTGLNMSQIHEIVGVVKAYGSYVGTNQDFPDIDDKQLNEQLRQLGQEFGATTGRPRRLCWLDLDRIKKATMINGPTKLAITRMDTLGQLPIVKIKYKNTLHDFQPWGDLKGITSMADLPDPAKQYLNFVEKVLSTPIWAVGIGPGRNDLLISE